jgi:hypothetical protein
VNYQFFRLSLSENAAPPLLERSGIIRRPAREAFLRTVFSKERVFTHWKQDFKYRYFGTSGDVIYGAIGREHEEGTHDADFTPGTVKKWEIANVFLDTSGDKDVQKLVVQCNPKVGQPSAFVFSFIDHLNDTESRDAWWTTVFNMSDQSDLWDAEKKYRGQITRINLRFAVPNMLGSSDAISEELKEIGKEIHGQEVEMDIIRQQGGLSLQSSYIKSAIDYISQGAGQIIVKVRRKIIYNSKNKHFTKTVEDDIDNAFATENDIIRAANELLDK